MYDWESETKTLHSYSRYLYSFILEKRIWRFIFLVQKIIALHTTKTVKRPTFTISTTSSLCITKLLIGRLVAPLLWLDSTSTQHFTTTTFLTELRHTLKSQTIFIHNRDNLAQYTPRSYLTHSLFNRQYEEERRYRHHHHHPLHHPRWCLIRNLEAGLNGQEPHERDWFKPKLHRYRRLIQRSIVFLDHTVDLFKAFKPFFSIPLQAQKALGCLTFLFILLWAQRFRDDD